jgi:hypothetical protein
MAILNKVKRFFSLFGLRPTVRIGQPITKTYQEDPQVAIKIRKIRQLFIDNQAFINSRAYKPHSPDCKDPVICEKAYCWKFIPDKIVSKPYVVRITQENKKLKGKRVRRSSL